MRLKHLLGHIPNVFGAGVVTVLFVAFFIGLCWFVYRRERKGVYAHLERLPLEDTSHGR